MSKLCMPWPTGDQNVSSKVYSLNLYIAYIVMNYILGGGGGGGGGGGYRHTKGNIKHFLPDSEDALTIIDVKYAAII